MLDTLSPRLALRQRTGEMIEIERGLAIARVVLSASFLAAICLGPAGSFPEPSLVFGLVLFYSAHAIALLVMLWRWDDVSLGFSWAVQTTDILWACVISIITNGPHSLFFLYLIFALLAAAFRWGMREALLTMVVAIAALAGEAFALRRVWFAAPDGTETGIAFALRIVYLIVFGLLIGYLSETGKRSRAEALGISQVLSKVGVDAGLKGSLRGVMQELLKLFRGRELLMLARESGTRGATLWRVERVRDTGEMIFSWKRLDDVDVQPYLCELPAQCAGAAWLGGRPASAITIDRDGNPLHGSKFLLSPKFVSQHPFGRLLTSSMLFAPDLFCRLFLLGPTGGGWPKEQLRFLRDLTNRVAPAVYNVYLLHRLRSRATAAERARIARDLHDGVVQSLHALAFRLYALRAGTMSDSERTQELLDLQELAQAEASNLRGLIQHLQPFELDPSHLVTFLAGMVERYGYDTGIRAKFFCDVKEVTLPPATCREIAGIVQEALANVLKHSAAENVEVRLALQTGAWILTVEDDGRGFEFSGRRSQSELELMRRGPLIIKERARAIGGELMIDSRPGQGARLEIKFLQPPQGDVA